MDSETKGIETNAEPANAGCGAAVAAAEPVNPTVSTGEIVAIDQSENHTQGAENEKNSEETYKPCGGDDSTVKARKVRGPDTRQRRQKGTGGLQLEKTGMWTVRALINGKRVSKSTGTKDRAEAERFLKRFMAPYVMSDPQRTYENIQAAVMTEEQLEAMREERGPQMKLSEMWDEYRVSPMRRDLAQTTLNSKEQVCRTFVEYMSDHFPEVTEVRHVRRDHVEAYLNLLRDGHSSQTYNNRLCVLREMYRVLMPKARAKANPWEGFQMRADDSHTRRELTVEELARLIDVASRQGFEWRVLFAIAMYTGMRLGDCCRLTWSEVDIVRSVIQKIPAKTKKYRKGRPITVPIHRVLSDLLVQTPREKRTGYVLPVIGKWAEMGAAGMGRIHHRLGKIFHNAGIVTSVAVEGRKWKAPEAGFHSLRHTFVSMSANAGVPLHIVQSIVGHESNAMTRHYYHENVAALQQAVEAIPSISETGEISAGEVARPDASRLFNRLKPQMAIGAGDGTTTPALPVPTAAEAAPDAQEAPKVVSADGIERDNPNADAPLAGRSAAKNAARRVEKLAAVETANRAAARMGGWGLPDEKGAQLPTVNRRQRQEWISKCVRKWCLRSKLAILEGTTMLLGNGGYRFLQKVWDGGTPMLPDEAVDAMEVFLRAKGVKK